MKQIIAIAIALVAIFTTSQAFAQGAMTGADAQRADRQRIEYAKSVVEKENRTPDLINVVGDALFGSTNPAERVMENFGEAIVNSHPFVRQINAAAEARLTAEVIIEQSKLEATVEAIIAEPWL